MADNVIQMHQPLTQDDWKFIFDVLEGTKLDVPRIRSEVARLQATLDCRTCRHHTEASGGCMSVLQCYDASEYQRALVRQCWKKE